MFILRAATPGKEWFYTGRAAAGWISQNRAEAFTYQSFKAAEAKAALFNSRTALHNLTFSVMSAGSYQHVPLCESNWPDPTPEMLNDPCFEAVWQTIKSWDINVPHAYSGYMGATGNHVRAILDALRVTQ